MIILYYNLQLGCFDGSNSHAEGMLSALRRIHGKENVVVANAQKKWEYNHAAASAKASLGPGIDLPRMVRKRLYAKKAAQEISDRVRRAGFAPDVLLARSTLYDSAPVEIARALGCRLVTEANTPLEYECCDLRHASLRPLVRSFEHELYRASDGVYCVSSVLADMLADGCGVPEGKLKVIPNGYSADLYKDFDNRAATRSRVRAEEGVDDAFVVTFLGSLQSWHGIERLVSIADAMKEREGKKTVFWVLGDGSRRELVQSRAEEFDDFRWFGNVDAVRMRDLLYASDLGIMPYERIDKFYFSPLKMYDMIGAGLPYVGLRIGQIEEESPSLLKENCLLDSTDPSDYVDKITELRDGDSLPSLRDAVRSERSRCSWDERARELTGWLEETVL